jgi:tRNA nucleotidyltransferase (CCA-adding enzyme)
MFNLNKSKLVSPLIVVDPLQKDRNAAAALSLEKFEIFKKAAKEFLKKPSSRFFIETKFDLGKLRKKGAVIVEAAVLHGKEDVVGSKLLKVFEFVQKELCEFGVKKAGWEWTDGKAFMYFILKNKTLPAVEIRRGPEAKQKDFVKGFKKKHKRTFVKKGRVYTREKRKFRKAEDFIKNLLKDRYVKERVKKCVIS